ncbi:protein Aster-C-like [Homarus americanus]|uniref:protein Aster-C-like n=1 Tax=Homarus americanus TaxID=6706 RepID=UPI001C44A005|nr:protein Aster-C-like [Homarus americanus]
MTVYQAQYCTSRREDRSASYIATGERRGESPNPRPSSSQMPVASSVHANIYTSRERLQRLDNSSESDDTTARNGVGEARSWRCPGEEQHQGKEAINVVIALPVDTVFDLLFVQEQFMLDIYSVRKTYDIVIPPWQDMEEGQKSRQLTFTMTLPSSNLVASKVSYVTEKQVIQSQTQPGLVYVVETETVNSGIPYADAFYIATHYCIMKEDEIKTRLVTWVCIKYKKTIWGFLKGLIEKNTFMGVEGLFAEISQQLTKEAEKRAPPAMGMRHRRRGQTGGEKTRSNTNLHKTGPTPPPPEHSRNCSWAVVMVLTALVALGMGNLILFARVRWLEHHSILGSPLYSTPATKYLSVTGSWEAVARILQRQEGLHVNQMNHWKAKLRESSHTLQQVQQSLETLLKTIPEHEELLKLALLQESADVETGWLEAEARLEQQLQDLEGRHTQSQNTLEDNQ